MGLSDVYNFDFLENEAEEIVKDLLEKEMENDSDICDCQDCVLDIVALALNNIKPLYKTSLKGSMYASTVDERYLDAAEKAVKYAIEKIKANPSH